MKNKLNLVGAAFSWIMLSIGAFLLFGTNGNAYIDPSVMTYLIQAVAGIVIAVGAVIGVYFRRAKKKINDKLGIDENRNKEVESDEILIKEEASDVEDVNQ